MTQIDRLVGHILLSTLVTNTSNYSSIRLSLRQQPDTRKSGTGGPRGTDERDEAGPRAAGSRKRPTGPHYYNSLVSGIYVRTVGAL
eukprot:scaffold92820_cov55-Attheya_sp.AAC.1